MRKIHLNSVPNPSRRQQALVSASTLALMLLAAAPTSFADTKPTALEVTKARADCATNKQRVRALEAANADEQKLSEARLTWEHSCVHAQDLISAAAGAKPAPAPTPPPAASDPAPEPAPAPSN